MNTMPGGGSGFVAGGIPELVVALADASCVLGAGAAAALEDGFDALDSFLLPFG
jgi:hypothetical protein